MRGPDGAGGINVEEFAKALSQSLTDSVADIAENTATNAEAIKTLLEGEGNIDAGGVDIVSRLVEDKIVKPLEQGIKNTFQTLSDEIVDGITAKLGITN